MRSKYWPSHTFVSNHQIKGAHARGEPTVCITADCQLHVLGDVHLNHGGLVVHNVPDGNNDLIDVFLVDQLAVLEPLDHVVDKLLCHLVLLQAHAVVGSIDGHRIDIETLGGGQLITDFDSGEEGELAHDLLALDQLELGILVIGGDLDAGLEVLDGFLGVQDGGVGGSATVVSLDKMEVLILATTLVCDFSQERMARLWHHQSRLGTYLDKARVELNGFGGIANSISVCFCLEMGLCDEERDRY